MKDLDDLSPEDVQRNLAIHKALLQERHPELAVDRGPLHDIVLYYSAAFATANQQYVQNAMRVLNITRLVREADKTPKDLVDRVAANWFVTRKEGKPARGLITFVVDSLVPLNIPAGFSVIGNGITYRTEQAYTIRTSDGSTVHKRDRVLTKLGQGQFAFTIPVVAAAPGAAANLRRGTRLKMSQEISSNVRKVFVEKDFTGGCDEESNAKVLGRLLSGTSAKTWSNRLTANAVVGQEEKFERVTDLSVIGFGDAEMCRDRHSIWPGSTGGRVDMYVRSADDLQTKEVTLPGIVAVLPSDGSPCWRVHVNKDVAPGFYTIESVHRVGQSKLLEFECKRNFAVGDDTVDIKTPEEAAYSSYQTADVYVKDLSIGSTDKGAHFVLTFKYMGGLPELQARLLDRTVVAAAGDVLVKAPIPCFVRVDVGLIVGGNVKPDVDELKRLIAQEINNTKFDRPVVSGTIAAVLFNYLRLYPGWLWKDIKLSGKLFHPDGKVVEIPAGSKLPISADSTGMVSHRTVGYFLTPEDVNITVSRAED